jgi:hypothetical protein
MPTAICQEDAWCHHSILCLRHIHTQESQIDRLTVLWAYESLDSLSVYCIVAVGHDNLRVRLPYPMILASVW